VGDACLFLAVDDLDELEALVVEVSSSSLLV
jgi:hypothetical protein